MSDRAPLTRFRSVEESVLFVATMNSIVLDFAARTSVGGTDLSYFIIKQLPVFPPETYQRNSICGPPWAELIVPRALELTYTSDELSCFAKDLGYVGPPFRWDEKRRHCIRCELDGVFAHMYGLTRDELEWILDAPPPSSSFPSLKTHELAEFGEYRTMRLVLRAYDLLQQGFVPDLTSEQNSDT